MTQPHPYDAVRGPDPMEFEGRIWYPQEYINTMAMHAKRLLRGAAMTGLLVGLVMGLLLSVAGFKVAG